MKHIIVPNVIFVDKHSENETVAKRKELETKVWYKFAYLLCRTYCSKQKH